MNDDELLLAWYSWLVDERGLSKETGKMYRWRVRYFLRLTGKTLREIDTADIRRHLLEICPKPNTKAAAIHSFRSVFKYLRSVGVRDDDPTAPLRFPKIAKTLPRYLSIEEAAKLDEAASWEGLASRALCRVYLYQGLRAAEGARLAWQEPTRAEDPEGLCTGVVDLAGGWIRVLGKGAKERDLPIHPKTREALKHLHDYRRSNLWVFPQERNPSLPITTSMPQRAAKRWAKAAGIDPRRVTVHKLRHTFATNYLGSGADITYVQAALGHSNIEQTMAYARVRKEDLRRTMPKLHY